MTIPSRGGAFTVELVDNSFPDANAKPHSQAPAKGDNDWTLQIDDAVTNMPLDGLMVTVKPRMPDHPQHGTKIPTVTPIAGQPGQYLVEHVYLFMAGLWEVTVEIQAATGASSGAGGAGAVTADSAVFPFCIPG